MGTVFVSKENQHPLVKEFASACSCKGATIYAGKNFLIARWDNGDRIELRVDAKKSAPASRGKGSADR